jgi:ureidoacrylate peracid hydrolase
MSDDETTLTRSPVQEPGWTDSILSSLEPTRTALAVIDVQNDFCSPTGALGLQGSDVTLCKVVAERISSAMPLLRRLVSCVAYFRLLYEPEKMSLPQRERLLVDGRPVLCAPTGTGGDFFRITPAESDLVFVKHRYSAFSVEAFRDQLRARDITTVLVAGVDTHICVEGTVRHGYDLGYRMVVLSDLVGTRQAEFHRHSLSLELCSKYFGIVVSSAELIRAMDKR